MFKTMSNAKAAYETVGLDMGVEAASSHRLILMLLDGAIVATRCASAQSEAGDRLAMSESIIRASAIISQGLRDSLDIAAGGELAERLAALYDYMCVRLQFANIRGEAAIFEEVSGLLSELRSAWEKIADDPAVVSANKAVA